mmetsp:Transcript_27882/g.42166  ORF Transcript_27882/g.42166 Transcript_27882/m.42166 type:complete len:111 (+) Transcript_27882:70-402(+)
METLLILPEEVQFRNCFDKALLLMIKRGMDVKELVNSQLFYATIWKNHSIYCHNKEPVMSPYNGDLDDLEFEDPDKLFADFNDHADPEEEDQTKKRVQLTSLATMRKMYN